MANLTTDQLIKIILGALVVVVVGVGIFLFFKFGVIDFFKNLIGGDEEEKIKEEITPETKSILETCRENVGEGKRYKTMEECLGKEEPLRLCEDCRKFLSAHNSFVCTEKECFEIDVELREFGKKCQFIQNKKNNPFDNKCITLNI